MFAPVYIHFAANIESLEFDTGVVQSGATLVYGELMVPSADKRKTVRLSVTLDEGDHTEIKRLARQLDLSTAWVVRRAVKEFVERHREPRQTELPLRRTG